MNHHGQPYQNDAGVLTRGRQSGVEWAGAAMCQEKPHGVCRHLHVISMLCEKTPCHGVRDGYQPLAKPVLLVASMSIHPPPPLQSVARSTASSTVFPEADQQLSKFHLGPFMS